MLEHKTQTLYQKQSPVKTPWSTLIEDELTAVEIRLRETPQGQHPMLTSTIQDLFDAGGKRIRPSLCLLTAGLVNATTDHAISMAAAVEMLHTATLVHDDLIDGATFRRGAPTLNSLWSSDIAVLAGDYLFARAASLIAEVEIVPIMKLFAKTLEIILNGEITQKFSKWQIDRQEYQARIYAKTAALFVLSAHSAALLGGADQKTVGALIQFSRAIGMAFQIVDDILDYVGMPDKLGKPIGGDLSQGLFTLPAILFAERYPQDEALNYLLTLQEADPDRVHKVVEKVQESGVIKAAMQEARTFLHRGQQALKSLPHSAYKDSLLDLAAEVVDREI